MSTAKYPNRDALRKAHDIYLDAMYQFVSKCLDKVQGTTAEELIRDALSLELHRDIEEEIEISHIARLVRTYWRMSFEREFRVIDRYYEARSAIGLIVEGRNRASHPPWDLDPEFTRTHLSLIADVLGKISRPGEQREVEAIRDVLFSNDTAERLAAANERLKTAEAENTKYKKSLVETEKQMKTAELRRVAYEKHNAELSQQVDEKEKRLKELSQQLKRAKTENDNYKKELAGAKQGDDRTDTVTEAGIPSVANDFPYSGAELKAMREQAGLTQVAVALALGLAAGSSAGVGDWEAERLKVPARHHAKLKELYSMTGTVRNWTAVTSDEAALNAEIALEEREKTDIREPEPRDTSVEPIAERYTSETTEEARDEIAVKVANLRINATGSKLSWRKIREKLGLKNDEFHKVIRLSDGYRTAVIARIKELQSAEGGWEYSGKLEVLTGIEITEKELE